MNERAAGPLRSAISAADAFVHTQAVTGVLRAMISDVRAPPPEEIFRALTRIVSSVIAR